MNYLAMKGKLDKIGHKGSEYLLDRSYIIADPSENIREDYGDIEGEDLESIADGIKLPLVGYVGDDGMFHTCDGFRRLRKYDYLVAQGMGEAKIPVKIDFSCSTPEGRVLLALNLSSGKHLSLIEQGKGYVRLRDLDMTPEAIAAKVGKSKQHVNNCISLIDTVDSEVLDLIDNGQVSATTVIETYQSSTTPDQAKSVISDAVKLAKANGKSKATAKDIKEVRPTKSKVTLPEKLDEYQGEVLDDWAETEEVSKDDLVGCIMSATNLDWEALSIVELQSIASKLGL